MSNLFLYQSKQFNQIVERLNTTSEILVDRITRGLKKLDIILEENDDMGKELSGIIEDYGHNLSSVTLLVLGRSDKQLNELFGSLYFKDVLDDCPNCGCETNTEYDGYGFSEYEIQFCTNSSCDYKNSNEPDID